MTDTFIYHITSRPEWEQALAAGFYNAPSLAAEGFIHCSTRAQVLETAERYYQGRSDLVLLNIQTDRLKVPLRYEDSHQNGVFFPHIYGPMALEAVVAVTAFPSRPDGLFDWPAGAITE
jgi:uncharacterized protein (DUF952 family)